MGWRSRLSPGIDDHSRFIACAKVVVWATARPVCQALTGALGRHGVPAQILTDNGKVFTARFSTGPGPVMSPPRGLTVTRLADGGGVVSFAGVRTAVGPPGH